MNKFYIRKKINECDGGVCMPVQTLCNTNGIGNPVPAGIAGTTAAEQSSADCIGSGDKFGSGTVIKKHRKDFKRKKKNLKNDGK